MYKQYLVMLKRTIVAPVLAFALLVPMIAAAETDPSAQFKLAKAADGLYSFGNGMTFGAFLVTDEGVIVMDPINPFAARLMQAAIRTVTDQPVVTVIYSHNHWDHIAGGQVFKDDGAKVLAHADITDFLVNHPAPNKAVVKPDESWEGERHDIELGGQTVELHHFGPSHGLGMTVFRFPLQNTVFVVDLVVPNRVGFAYMPDFTPRGWLATLDRIEALDFDNMLFGHNAAVGPRSALGIQREFILDMQNEIRSRIDAGEPPMQVVNTIELPKYKDWMGYDMWLKMNAWRLMLEMNMGV